MTEHRCAVVHEVMPGAEVGRIVPRKGETVTALLRRTDWATRSPEFGWQFRNKLPTVLILNGEPVLQKDWRKTRIKVTDEVRFLSYPRGGQGGSGKQVLGLVALVALAAFAGPLGGAIANAAMLPAWAGTAIGAGIRLGGELHINILEKLK